MMKSNISYEFNDMQILYAKTRVKKAKPECLKFDDLSNAKIKYNYKKDRKDEEKNEKDV